MVLHFLRHMTVKRSKSLVAVSVGMAIHGRRCVRSPHLGGRPVVQATCRRRMGVVELKRFPNG